MDRDIDSFYCSLTETWDEYILKLYATKDFSDVVLVAKFENESVHFPAHRLVLARSSPILKETLYNSKAGWTNDTIICNAQPKVVETVLRYMYFRKDVEFESLVQCFDVLSLATTYELSTLRKICTNYIEGFIDVEHVCSVYQIAVSVRNKNLELESLHFIQKHTKDILKHSSWMDALPVTLQGIVKQEYLNIDSELQLFEAIINWAKRRLRKLDVMSNNSERLRQEIEPFLPHIRFMSMDEKIFLGIAAATRVFTNDEIATIGLNFAARNSGALPVWLNRSENCRAHEYKRDENDTFRGYWFNMNRSVYLHSEPVGKLSSIFKAKCKDFSIHQLLIGICDECVLHNVRSKIMNISMKVTIKVDTLVRETSIILPILYYVEHRRVPKFEEKEPVFLTRSVSGKLVSNKNVGMPTSSIVQLFQDSDSSKSAQNIQTCSPMLSRVIDFEPPVYVQSEERFELSIETLNMAKPFFCCKWKPCFENVPFIIYSSVSGKTEDPEVWCTFVSIGYSVCNEENILCD